MPAANSKGGGAAWKPRSKALEKCKEVVHIADCESDSYELMARMLDDGQRFVLRVRVSDRRGRKTGPDQDESWSTVKEVAESCEGLLERDVPLSRRKKNTLAKKDKAHPPRKGRMARLRFSATRVLIPRPHRLRSPFPETLALNLVHVSEPDPPPGQPAVCWLLYTTEAIDTVEQGGRRGRPISFEVDN